MKARLQLLAEAIRTSYWFVPSLMLVGGAILAICLVTIDQRVDTQSLRGLWWIFSGGAEGARSLLSTVSGSIIGVAGTTFSITIAVLSLTSSQFGPRLLRGFLRDTANQVVLGTFVSTYLYCLLVLRTIRSVEEIQFVPHLAVTGGVLLAIASVATLIYFIHHVSNSVQASRIIDNVVHELESSLERLFPDKIGEEDPVADDAPPTDLPDFPAQPVVATESGYVQAIDSDSLLKIARDEHLVLHLQQSPGSFLVPGSVIAIAFGSTLESSTARRINGTFSLGGQRTATQDAEFLVLELVEVAVRALSPGINDPFTAVMCIDRLAEALCHLSERKLPSPLRFDEDRVLRVVAPVLTFPALVDASFDQIYHYGHTDPLVYRHLIKSLRLVEACARTDDQKRAIQDKVRQFTATSPAMEPKIDPA